MNSGILVELKTENGIRNLSVDRGIGLRELAEKYHNGEGERGCKSRIPRP